MTTGPHHPGDTDTAAEDPAPAGEDLAALLTRLLEEAGRTQKELATETGIKYPTLNAWVNRTRGTSRIDPQDLRAIVNTLRLWQVEVTPAQMFKAAGRKVPGPSDAEREARLLKIYRELPTEGQRALIQTAEAMKAASRT
ncbi:helix-turn-helix transcriptional regulator [Streptomyces sp. NPDC094048]|uniref:helix-turn-helix domain-containing protein n=1 Tax=unclassified Streptomyces TaxID=2593676 RepID=UPI00332A1969